MKLPDLGENIELRCNCFAKTGDIIGSGIIEIETDKATRRHSSTLW
jgi:hypothetical protein